VRFATRQIPAAGPSFTPERLATPSFPIGPDWQSPRRETSARRICGERRADARDRTAPWRPRARPRSTWRANGTSRRRRSLTSAP